jgi:hypothetical protein
LVSKRSTRATFLSRMAARQDKIDLTADDITDDERKTIRELMGEPNSKDYKSKMACFAHYCKLYPDKEVQDSRGQIRLNYCMIWMTHNMRRKNATKSLNTERAVEIKQKKGLKLNWMSEEVMNREIGTDKAIMWREKKLVPSRGDRFTGSMDKKYIEYGVPFEWQEMTEEDLKRIVLITEAEGGEEDMALLNNLSAFGPQAGSGSASSSNPVLGGVSAHPALTGDVFCFKTF